MGGNLKFEYLYIKVKYIEKDVKLHKFIATTIREYLNEKNEILLAPNGGKSILPKNLYDFVRTDEFKKWFGDWENNPNSSSKVVDYNGEPMLVFHGTKTKFDVFDKNKINSNYKQSIGFHFSHSYEHAKNVYAKENGYVKVVFLNIRNPLLIEAKFGTGDEAEETIDINRNIIKQKLTENNFDGIIAKGANYTKSFVVFDSNQIKSFEN